MAVSNANPQHEMPQALTIITLKCDKITVQFLCYCFSLDIYKVQTIPQLWFSKPATVIQTLPTLKST
jgi:hypothetical protein